MSLAGQALPLVGVAIGAVVSLAVSAVNERTRWRRRQVASKEMVYGFDLIRGFAPALG